MREMTLEELNNSVRKSKDQNLIGSIDKLIEASPDYSLKRRKPKDKTEAKILKSFWNK